MYFVARNNLREKLGARSVPKNLFYDLKTFGQQMQAVLEFFRVERSNKMDLTLNAIYDDFVDSFHTSPHSQKNKIRKYVKVWKPNRIIFVPITDNALRTGKSEIFIFDLKLRKTRKYNNFPLTQQVMDTIETQLLEEGLHEKVVSSIVRNSIVKYISHYMYEEGKPIQVHAERLGSSIGKRIDVDKDAYQSYIATPQRLEYAGQPFFNITYLYSIHRTITCYKCVVFY